MRQVLEKIKPILSNPAWNMYDIAVMTKDGLETARLRPCNACNDSYSVAKAFVMTAIGVLRDRGLIDVRDNILDALDKRPPIGYDRAWDYVTIEDALTHRIGFDKGFLDIDTEDVTRYPTDDYLSIVLSAHLPHMPGEHFCYSDAAFYLLSRLAYAVSGSTVDEILRETFFTPLKSREVAWSRCPQGYPIGATGLYVRAEDMAKLAWTYMHGGVCDGVRVVSEEWTRMARDNGYELHPLEDTGFVGKGGMYGQMMMFDAERDVAVAWHAFTEEDVAAQIAELF